MSPAMTNAAITLTSEVESVLGSLSDLLDIESDAVQASDFDAFRNLQNDKFALMTRYRALMETLTHQAPFLKQAGDTVVGRITTATERLQASTKRNALMLESGRNSMQRIVDRIVRAARETVHADRQSYNRNGRSHNGGGTLSIRVDEVL